MKIECSLNTKLNDYGLKDHRLIKRLKVFCLPRECALLSGKKKMMLNKVLQCKVLRAINPVARLKKQNIAMRLSKCMSHICYCSMLHEIASVPTSFFTIVDDPEFVDRANGDYHLNSSLSPAMDYCFANNSDHPDMDFETRGWDDPMVPNNNGPYDIGADESYVNDVIFKDSFEE